MPSSSLADKVARNPLRFGMIGGFLGVPLLWMAGDSLVRVVQGQGVLPAEAFWSYEGSGALAGAFIGGQLACMWASWRAGRLGEARSLALVTGGVGVAFYVAQAGFYAATSPTFLPDLPPRPRGSSTLACAHSPSPFFALPLAFGRRSICAPQIVPLTISREITNDGAQIEEGKAPKVKRQSATTGRNYHGRSNHQTGPNNSIPETTIR